MILMVLLKMNQCQSQGHLYDLYLRLSCLNRKTFPLTQCSHSLSVSFPCCVAPRIIWYILYVLLSPELHSYFCVWLSGSAAVVDVHTVFICLVMRGDVLEGAEKHRKLS